jgi:hypothetical protein
MMLRNQLKHGRFRVIGKLGAAPVGLNPQKLFPIQKLKTSKELSRLPASFVVRLAMSMDQNWIEP